MSLPEQTTAAEAGARDRAAWASVRRALADTDLLTLHAQPVVDLLRGEVAGYELLMRLADGTRPDLAIAAAEKRGAGDDLEALVVGQAVRMLDEAPQPRFLTVNVSPQRLSSVAFRATLEAAAGRRGSLRPLVVELTEHVPFGDVDALNAALAWLRSLGAMVAVDDAGTGYAGLSLLAATRPDLVKVDRELVAGLDTDPARASLVELLGAYAGRLDAWLLAEGVETTGELDALVAMGVPLAQGWALGRPGPGFCELDDRVREGLGRAVRLRELDEYVASLCLAPPTVAVGEVPEGRDPYVVVLDALGCPVGLVVHGAPAPVSLRCQLATTVVEAAHRAVAREPLQRFHPLVAVDATGRLAGLVPVERLLTHLAGRVT